MCDSPPTQFEYSLIPNLKISKIELNKWLATLKRAVFILDSETICTSPVVKASILEQLQELKFKVIEVLEDDE